MNIRKECRNSGQRPSCSSVHFPSRGRARWVGGRRWPLSRRSQFSKNGPFISLGLFFGVQQLCLFFKGMVSIWDFLTAGYASSYEGAHPMLP